MPTTRLLARFRLSLRESFVLQDTEVLLWLLATQSDPISQVLIAKKMPGPLSLQEERDSDAVQFSAAPESHVADTSYSVFAPQAGISKTCSGSSRHACTSPPPMLNSQLSRLNWMSASTGSLRRNLANWATMSPAAMLAQ